jgi:hypothetical protein
MKQNFRKKISSWAFIVGASLIVILMSCSKEESSNDPVNDHVEKIISVAGNVQSGIDEYRALLGTNNGGTAGSQGYGRREINWDGVPDQFSSPNSYPLDFFNTNTGTRARGAVFSSPGGEIQVSASKTNPTNTPMSFGQINPQYTQIFPPFSGEKVFSPTESNIVDLRFYIPGSTEKAVVEGFGAVYIDVDKIENTAFEYFDINEKSLGSYKTETMNDGFVFLGVLFKEPIVHHVRITYGNTTLGPDDGGSVDVSVMDDFIYGEPVLPK